jgi:hypothetical protein
MSINNLTQFFRPNNKIVPVINEETGEPVINEKTGKPSMTVKHGEPKGAFYGFTKDGKINIGWSLCNNHDRFCRNTAIQIAKTRAEAFAKMNVLEVPHSMADQFTRFLDRCKRCFDTSELNLPRVIFKKSMITTGSKFLDNVLKKAIKMFAKGDIEGSFNVMFEDDLIMSMFHNIQENNMDGYRMYMQYILAQYSIVPEEFDAKIREYQMSKYNLGHMLKQPEVEA